MFVYLFQAWYFFLTLLVALLFIHRGFRGFSSFFCLGLALGMFLSILSCNLLANTFQHVFASSLSISLSQFTAFSSSLIDSKSPLLYKYLSVSIWAYYARCGCVFIRETQNLPHNVSKQNQNDIFPKHMGLHQTEYNFFMQYFKIKCCCSDLNNWNIWEKCDRLRCMIEC